MSSARRKSSLQKAKNDLDNLNQRLMLAEHQNSILTHAVNMIAHRYEEMKELMKKVDERYDLTKSWKNEDCDVGNIPELWEKCVEGKS